MKTKSLFISTIAMVVLLVVALATGTFAWYTAQNTVNATGASVGAVQSNSAAIGLGWSNSTATSSSIALGGGDVRPMIPTAAPATGDNVIDFEEALLSTDGLGNDYVKSVQDGDSWTQVGWDGSANTTDTTLYIGNLDATTPVTVQVTVNIAAHVEGADLNHLLRVAIFYAGTTPSLYTYVGTWGTGLAYADDLTAALADDLDELRPSEITVEGNKFTLIGSGSSSGVTIPLDGGQKRQLFLFAWLEGTDLNTTNMTLAASTFSINFTANQVLG